MNRNLRRRSEKLARNPPSSAKAAQIYVAGLQHHLAGRLKEACDAYRIVLALQPDHAEAYYGFGLALHLQGHLDKAIDCYLKAIVHDPRHALAFGNLSAIYKKLGRFAEAETAALQSLAIEPAAPVNLCNLAAALIGLEAFERAADALSKALAIDPNHVPSLGNLVGVLRRQGKLAEAIAVGRRAVALDPGDAIAQFNLALTLADSGEADASRLGFQRTITLDPTWADAHFGLAESYLRSGDFVLGWNEYEWRWRLKEYDWIKRYRILEKPRWGGEDISEKTILICAEQGLGDTIQFIRYVPHVVALAKRVILWIQPALRALLRNVEGVTLLGMDEEPVGFDVYCPLLSLPRVFSTSSNNVPALARCIEVDAEAVERWRLRLGQGGLRIGIAWQGKPGVNADLGRSIPLANFAPLARIPGVRLISLQKNRGAEQLANLPMGMQVETLGEDFDSASGAFIDTAAVMMNLELVITADTAIAHLAGSLQRPTWVALKRVADWRWGVGGAETPWYPSMRLFRQTVANDWGGVFLDIAEALSARVCEIHGEDDAQTARLQ